MNGDILTQMERNALTPSSRAAAQCRDDVLALAAEVRVLHRLVRGVLGAWDRPDTDRYGHGATALDRALREMEMTANPNASPNSRKENR